MGFDGLFIHRITQLLNEDIKGSRVKENMPKHTTTAPKAYLLLLNPSLNIVSVLDLEAKVCIILDKVREKDVLKII